jgi:aromatic ring-opening dioxygenase LigB subunit
VPLVFAAIAPHGSLAIREACTPDDQDVAVVTQRGMQRLGDLFQRSRANTVVIATPHNVHISGTLGVVVSGRVSGVLSGAPPSIALDLATDAPLAWSILTAFGERGLPSVGISFGGNDPAAAVAPMDWGTLIPLWFMGGRWRPPARLVVVTPARDLPADAHVLAGIAIAKAAAASRRRVALIASADHGHAHDAEGPYGFDPAAREYDQLITELVRTDHLQRLSDIPPDLVEGAKADSWWQMLILHGATSNGWRGRLISYEAPTYFGMLTAAYTPARAATRGSASRPRTHNQPRTRARRSEPAHPRRGSNPPS